MDVNFILENVKAKLNCFSNYLSSLNPTACHPDTEGKRMVVTTLTALSRIAALHQGGAAKFASPDNQCRVEQSSLFQVCQQRRGGLVGDLTILLQVRVEFCVIIPTGMEQLHEPDAL